MPDRPRNRLPAGSTPWDPLNGFRIGVLAGGLAGAGALAVAGSGGVWLVLGPAAVGGAIGYWTEKRRQRNRRP
ncbi:MAG: hypothetical protein OEW42_16100 [Acidimicrobiia bacterium]|nr:hypothetical protein [Acidimicrobiia bacterium]MDH5237127.1 hypothetical protein [Acidimicrobiia bacterium]